MSEDSAIDVQAANPPRAGWDLAFSEMAARGDDALLDAEALSSDWDATEWQWNPEQLFLGQSEKQSRNTPETSGFPPARE